MGFARAGLYFWYELPGRLRLLGWRFRAVGGPGLKKVSPSHLYVISDFSYFRILAKYPPRFPTFFVFFVFPGSVF